MYCHPYVEIFQCSEISFTLPESKLDQTELEKNKYLATSPPKLKIFGFFEVIKCNSEAPAPFMFFMICK